MGLRSTVKRVTAWRRAEFPPIKALPIDMFNFKTDYSKSASVADLDRINEAQIAEAPRYRYLADSRETRDLVAALFDNALAITHHLTHASQLLIDSPSRLQQGQAELATAHAAFARLGDLDIKYSPEPMLIGRGFERIGGTAAFDWRLNEWVTERTSTPMRNVVLQYRASEHGWAGADFHRTCDNVPRLLVIARSTTGYVFGGFSAVGFCRGSNGNDDITDAAAFLFTLINPHQIALTMLVCKGDGKAALREDQSRSAMFGHCDLWFSSNCNTATISISVLGNPISKYSDITGKGSKLFTGAYYLGTMSELLAFRV